VTGASRGIGRSVALRLARDGYDIWGTYRTSDEKAGEVRKAVESLDRSCTMLKLDVSSFEQTASAIGSLVGGLNRDEQQLWALVNNAGITRDALVGWMQRDEWYDVIGTNLNAAFNVTKTALDEMMKQKGGRIVSITSVAGHTGNTGQANYAASKAALIGFSKSLAQEVGSRNITINCIAPGFIDTDMTKALPEAQRAKLLERIPLGRLGSPEDIAHAVVFLASPRAGYITGATLHVNGGMYMA